MANAVLCLGLFAVVGRASAEPIRVAATVTMVSDMVRSVGGDRVIVDGLMGPGVDPHLYKATGGDLRRLQQAQIIFYSGLHLEGKLHDVLSQLSKSERPVVAVTDSLPRSRLLPTGQGGESAYDPHVWFDVGLWALCIGTVESALIRIDPAGADGYRTRARETRLRLQALDQWAHKRAMELPESRRVLVTSHDAFNYFGRAYGFQVVALQGISTVTEAGLADITRLIDFVKKNKVPAVFVESSVSPASMKRIQSDSGALIGGELFSDAMGTPGQIEDGYDLGTYEGMIRHNLNTIVRALSR